MRLNIKILITAFYIIWVSITYTYCSMAEALDILSNNKFADPTNGTFVTSGSNNAAFGVNSLYELRTGSSNVSIGFEALYFNNAGNNNVAIGHDALYANILGNYNIGIGSDTLRKNIDGNYNVAMSYDVLHDNKSGNFNTAIGYKSLFKNISGNYNIGLGVYAGSGWSEDYFTEPATPNLIDSNTTGSGNIFIGNNTGTQADVNNSVAIGNNVVLTKSDSIIIGSRTNESVTINGSLNLGEAVLYGFRKIDISVQLPETTVASTIDIKIPYLLKQNEFAIIRPETKLVGKSRVFSIVTTYKKTNVLRVISNDSETNSSGNVSILILDVR